MAAAQDRRRRTGRRTIVFVDEIHRFNKAQQDAFLPRVEAGDIVLIGATTENPSFEVNAALLSRSKVFLLQPLGPTDARQLQNLRAGDAARRQDGLARLGLHHLAVLLVFHADAALALEQQAEREGVGDDMEVG